MRTLLVDPSDRGGIAAYTAMVADGLAAAGASSVWVLASVDVDAAQPDAPYIRRLPTSEWGRSGPAISFYARRLETWVRSAYAVAGAVRSTRPEIVHVQAPLNLRLDPHLLRAIRRRAAVIWTAHDVLPHEHTPGDERRVALVYRACDAVIVHSEAAADE
ncbi:MAG: glycosyltransferase family 4 protein, partial [Gaiellales bacterium]